MSEIVNQLKNQSYNEVNPSAFLQVGGTIYPDQPALFDVHSLVQIVEGYQKTHLIAYGGVIPNTYQGYLETATNASKTAIISPALNEVIEIMGLSVQNAGVIDPIGVKIWIEDTLVDAITVGPGQVGQINANHTISLVKGGNLYYQVDEGTATDAIISIATVKTSI